MLIIFQVLPITISTTTPLILLSKVLYSHEVPFLIRENIF